MFNIKFSSITIESLDQLRSIVIIPATYKDKTDIRVLQYKRDNTTSDYNWHDEIKYYHETLELAINYHSYFVQGN